MNSETTVKVHYLHTSYKCITWCGSLTKNGLHQLVCLNARSLGRGATSQVLIGGSHWGWAWSFKRSSQAQCLSLPWIQM